MPDWEVEETGPEVCTVRVKSKQADCQQWVLLTSDRHLDNPHSRLDMQRQHLEEAKRRNALVIDTGDLFCAMQGKMDRRSSKDDLREENQSGDYLGTLVREASSFFEPYKEHIALIGKGNHETAVTKRLEYDLTYNLVDRLNLKGANIVCGGYRGWVRFLFTTGGTRRQSILMHYSHGSGGGGPVTKGTIQANRRSTYIPDAHIVVSGHIHEAWQVEYCRARINSAGNTYTDEQTHVCLPTYKDEFKGEGFHAENERPPKPLGGWWLRFFWNTTKQRVDYELTRAK